MAVLDADGHLLSTSGDPVTFYVHVLDWSGIACPDFLYDLQISGAN